MKLTGLLLTLLFTMSAIATTTLHTQVIGRVVLEKNHTMTCLALNCPPSVSFYQLILDDAQVNGFGPVDTVIFQDFNKITGGEKPEFVLYGGVSLTEGSYIIVEADIRIGQSGEKIYAFAINPAQVRLVPPRYPVMLY